MELWRAGDGRRTVDDVTESATGADQEPEEKLMSWTSIYVPSVKIADLRQNAFALSFGGDATATNVGVVTNG